MKGTIYMDSATADELLQAPYRVEIKVDDRFKTDISKQQKLRDLLLANCPRRRTEKLRRHSELNDRVDHLLSELKAGYDIGIDLANAEKAAALLDVLPRLVRDDARQRGTRKKRGERQPEITEWIKERLAINPNMESADLWEAAPGWIKEELKEDSFYKRVRTFKK
jgi:hypothetical protein